MVEPEALIRVFRRLQPKFPRLLTRLLVREGLTLPQFTLLSRLADRGRLAMTEAGRELCVTKPAVTNLVGRLEKNRFLERCAHPRDGRSSLLCLRPKGGRAVRRIQSVMLRILLGTLAHFSRREKETVRRFYAALSEAVDQALEGG